MAPLSVIAGNRPQLSRHVVDAYKRDRILRATAECVHAVGMERVTVRLILRRCRMARATFYGIFPTKTEALEYACQAATDFLVGAVREARQDGEGTSRGTVVDGFLQAVDEEPLLAELCLVHSKSAPVPEADRFFSALIQELCEGLEGTRFDDELVALAIAQTVALQLRRKSNPNLREVRTALASWNLW